MVFQYIRHHLCNMKYLWRSDPKINPSLGSRTVQINSKWFCRYLSAAKDILYSLRTYQRKFSTCNSESWNSDSEKSWNRVSPGIPWTCGIWVKIIFCSRKALKLWLLAIYSYRAHERLYSKSLETAISASRLTQGQSMLLDSVRGDLWHLEWHFRTLVCSNHYLLLVEATTTVYHQVRSEN